MKTVVTPLVAAVAASLVGLHAVTVAQPPTPQSSQSPSIPGVNGAAAASLPPSAGSLAFVSLPRVLLGTAVGKASTARVNEARAQGREREVRAAEEQQLQWRVQPLARALRVQNGLGILLAWRGSGLLWSDGTLDLTRDLQSMLDAGDNRVEARTPRGVCRLAFVDAQKLFDDSWLGNQLTLNLQGKAIRRAEELSRYERRGSGTVLISDYEAREVRLQFLQRILPVLSDFGRETATPLLVSASDAGMVWSDRRLDATAALVARIDKAVSGKGPRTVTWSPPPLVIAYVRLRALADAAGLAHDAAAAVARLGEKLSSQPSDDIRRALADAQAKLKREVLQVVTPVAERECRARGITVLFSFTDSGILDADAALDLTDALVRGLAGRRR